MHLVWTDVGHLIVAWFWCTWQDLLESHGLSFDQLLPRQTGLITVRHSPQSVVCETGSHVPILWMDDKLRVDVAELLEVIVYLIIVNRNARRQVVGVGKALFLLDFHLHLLQQFAHPTTIQES